MVEPDSRSRTRERARTARPTSTSRIERRRAARVRRNRLVLAVATASSVAILAAWFPASDLLHQRAQLASSSSQLGRLDHENAALRHREEQLRTPSNLGRIAQQQYGLVPPGEQAYQVLPPSGSGSSGTLGATPGTGAGGSPGASSGPHNAEGGGASGTSGGRRGSFLDRVLETLEFWR